MKETRKLSCNVSTYKASFFSCPVTVLNTSVCVCLHTDKVPGHLDRVLQKLQEVPGLLHCLRCLKVNAGLLLSVNRNWHTHSQQYYIPDTITLSWQDKVKYTENNKKTVKMTRMQHVHTHPCTSVCTQVQICSHGCCCEDLRSLVFSLSLKHLHQHSGTPHPTSP